ncbi:hypothetical protein GS682_04100 [Nostoc sp. B(2019)]|nr:hypothetical protein [Nostoc sp. B(2019)]
MNKEIENKMKDELRSKYDFAQMEGSIRGKYVKREELEDEIRWDKAFAGSKDTLAKLAAEAMAEYYAGKTQELDAETL